MIASRRPHRGWCLLVMLGCSFFRLAGATLLSGHVTDSRTHLPIANASVGGSIYAFPYPQNEFSKYTGADGYYEVDLPSGNYNVAVMAATYLTKGADVEVDAASTVADFEMDQPASISGTVRHAGNGVPYAEIFLFDAVDATRESSTSSYPDGTYLIDGIAPGDYALCVVDPDDAYLDQCYNGYDVPASGERTFTTLTLHSGDAPSLVDFDLHTGATISGTLHDSLTNAPIANADITFTLYSSTEKVVESFEAPTDADGQFAIGGIAPGSYYLEAGATFFASPANSYYVSALHGGAECTQATSGCIFTEASLFSVSPGGAATGVDFQLRPGHLVSGKVTDAVSGLGLAGVTVKSCEWIGLIFETAETVTAADGSYQLSHVVGPGSIAVSTANGLGYVDQLWNGIPLFIHYGCPIAGSTLVFDSPGKNLTDIDFGLARPASIAGHVVPSAIAGNPTLQIFGYDGSTLSPIWYGNPDANGDFEITGLPAGTYFAFVWFDGYQDCRVYAGYACIDNNGQPNIDPQQATPIVVVAGEVLTHIDFPAEQEIFGNSFD